MAHKYQPEGIQDEVIDVFSDIILERIIEERNIIKEKIKNDPEAKKKYGTCNCSKCWIRRFKLRMKE